jgi:hypothetical protein
MVHCLAAVEEGRRVGVAWQSSGRDCLMGIDQMGGWNAVIIKRRLPDGRQAVVHVEAIFDEDPFARCSALMDQFGVSVCVTEQLPNVNDARRFANRHRGRVFLAGYADLRDDMIVWGDDLSRSDRRTADEDRSRYTVTMHQYKAMQTALYRIRDRFCLFPDPVLLEQQVITDGRRERVLLLRNWVFLHFTKTALVVEEHPETRRPRPKVLKVGLDPHFSYANMLCDIAWARNHGAGSCILPETTPVATMSTTERLAESLPGLSLRGLGIVGSVPSGVCGRCTAFQNGRCTERGFSVVSTDPGCPLFVPVPA